MQGFVVACCACGLFVAGCAARPAAPPALSSADIAADPSYAPPDVSGLVLDERALEPAKPVAKRAPKAARLLAPNAPPHERQAREASADPTAAPSD